MIKGIFILQQLNKEKINKMLQLGANAVFISYKNLREDLIDELGRKSIKIYAEIGLFVGRKLWEKYPDCRPIDGKGELIPKFHWYSGVCPNHPQVRKEKLQLMKELIERFDIDGLWLDFIRYPCHWEVPHPDLTEYCFCPNCLERFSKVVKTPRGWPDGLPRGGRKIEEAWIQWKCDQITNFVAKAHSLIAQSGKKIELGMFSVPWKEEDFGGAIKKVVGQDFKRLAEYVDVFSPMVYHEMCGRTAKWIHEVVAYMGRVTGKPTLPIIQTEDKPEKISKEEFREKIKEATKRPSQGAIVFFLENLLKDKGKTKIVKEAFK